MKPRANVEKIKELLGGIADRRFLKLQKRLIWDLDAAGFKTIDLGLYLRLGGWSHTGGTYINAMMEVQELCKTMYGYELPGRIGEITMKELRYRTMVGLGKIAAKVIAYHDRRLK